MGELSLLPALMSQVGARRRRGFAEEAFAENGLFCYTLCRKEALW